MPSAYEEIGGDECGELLPGDENLPLAGNPRGMRVTRDEQARAVYVQLTDRPVARTQEVGDDVNVDFDKDGEPVGVEVLY